MKLLLDTRIRLWSQLEPARLSRRVAGELQSLDNELWLSPTSVREALTLCEKGRLTLADDAAQWIEKALRAVSLKEAPLFAAQIMGRPGASVSRSAEARVMSFLVAITTRRSTKCE